MNYLVAVLVAVCVGLWNQPMVIARLHRLELNVDPITQIDVAGRIKQRWQRKQQSAQQTQRIIDALAALDAELKSGQPPNSALIRAADVPPLWPAALAAIGMGGDVAQALRIDAQHLPQLLQLAACWQVGARSGSGMSAAVGRLLQSLRHNEELRATLEAELAGPRASAKILSGLPLIGLLLGIMMGADPVGWLVGNPIGWACLVSGLALTATGAVWSQRMVRTVEAML